MSNLPISISSNAGRPDYVFTRNDPFNKMAPIQLVVEQEMSSAAFMASIRNLQVPADGIALWFLGQNGFVLKDSTGFLLGIDLYLTNHCAQLFPDRACRLDRQLPILIEPEDLELDVFITTHSHEDHADVATITRLNKGKVRSFVGPWDSFALYGRCGIEASQRRLIHPGETIRLADSLDLTGTFAIPTDDHDLNHIGVLLRFGNGIRFFNSGDTAYAKTLAATLPTDVDICSLCMNGNVHNLSAMEAALIAKEIRPRVCIPCHYDMMVNNVGNPDMFRTALDLVGADTQFHMMRYYEPWIYRRPHADTALSTAANPFGHA